MAKGKSMIKSIEEKENRYFMDIFHELKEQGYRNCDIATKYGIAQSTINQYLKRIELTGTPEVYDRVKPKRYKKLDIKKIEKKHNMSFKELLIDLRYNQSKTCEEIASLLDSTESNIQRHMKKMGIRMSISEARVQSILTGRTNYAEIQRVIRNGHTRMLATGSSSEEKVRLTLKNYLEQELNDRFEYVIGFTNWSILRDKEIDIPIIIIDLHTQTTHKFAIEYDGARFHSDSINIIKKQRVEELGWTFFNIYDKDMSSQQLEEVIEAIFNAILTQVEICIH